MANSYLSDDQLRHPEPFYPLDVYFCDRCFLVQIGECAKADHIFSADYAYYSSYSDTWLEHCRAYVAMAQKRFAIGKDSFVVEIASNDGYLLQYFQAYAVPLLGVEPARNAAEVAMRKGIATDIAFFNAAYAANLCAAHKKADLIIGNNVLAHNPDLNDFVAGLRIALKSTGVVTMEFPHLLKLMTLNQFDTIYHEHYSYLSLHSVKRLFELHDLEIFDVDELPTHGGSLRIYAKHKTDRSKAVESRVDAVMAKEEGAGLLIAATYKKFDHRVRSIKRALLDFLSQEKNGGKSIAGYGAPAKGNTLLNYCGIGTDILDYTVDRNPHKQGKYLPGTHIPIRSPEYLREHKPDYVLILPWNLKDEIMRQLSFIREWGGRCIMPIPRLEVL